MLRSTLETLPRTAGSFLLILAGPLLAGPAAAVADEPPTPGLHQEAYVKAPNPDVSDWFGHRVAYADGVLVVGTYRRQAGAAYVFAPVSGAWVQEAYLKPSYAPGLYEHFGVSVAVTGETVVVGATGDDSPVTGVGVPDPTDSTAGSNSGAAYVFQRSGGSWTEVAFVKPSNTGVQDLFGHSAAAAGDTIVLGAILEDSGSKLVGGSQSDAFPRGTPPARSTCSPVSTTDELKRRPAAGCSRRRSSLPYPFYCSLLSLESPRARECTGTASPTRSNRRAVRRQITVGVRAR